MYRLGLNCKRCLSKKFKNICMENDIIVDHQGLYPHLFIYLSDCLYLFHSSPYTQLELDLHWPSYEYHNTL